MATTKEQLLKELKNILVTNGHITKDCDLNMQTDLIRGLELNEIEFSVVLCEIYEHYKDVMPEDEIYNYSEKHSKVEQIISWVLRWANKK